ncbi:MAG: T9SS type A sorting domain-containing protein, partial [Sphingobacteriales bacterium]
VDLVNNQVYCDGVATNAVTFTGTASSYTWTADNTAIGIPASGTNTIPSFTTVNPGPLPAYATVRVTPQGNGSTVCPGKMVAFRYVVNFCPPVTQAGDHSGDNNTGRISAGASFVVSPNPARGIVTVHYSGTQPGPFAVQLIDAFGQPAGRIHQFAGTTMTMDVTDVRPGAYLVRIVAQKTGAVVQKHLIKL